MPCERRSVKAHSFAGHRTLATSAMVCRRRKPEVMFANRAVASQFSPMTATLKKQAEAVIAKMNQADRVEFADMLYATLPNAYLDSVNRAWDRVVDRRLDEYEAGKVKTIPSAEGHASVRRRLNEIKARRATTRRAA